MTATRFPGWFAWPPLLYLVVFFVIPTAIVVSFSILRRDFYGQVIHEFSLEGWRQATEPYTLRILLRGLLLAAGVTLACVILAYPCALALARMDSRWRQVGVVLISFPLVTSLLLRIYGWMNLLPIGWQGTIWSVGLVMTASYLPFMLLPILRALERASADLAHAAMDLGATPWQTFWHVTFPISRAGMWAGCALVFIPASGEYLVPHFIGGGKVMVLGTLIEQEFMHRRNWPYASASAVWLLLVVTLPILLWTFKTRRSPVDTAHR
jgi:ABC-type spermidine/putrescine transport system permease subunit I